ncbi:MAG: methyltransferase domain-containing protein, partial [Deltaproteobacteria bacterium]|nr:methyltransferase domain-containing protein [Deltaproteobacteria bacterium]
LANAESLPFRSCSFDAALAVLTIHHWRSIPAGLGELRRVARDRVVILTYDPACDDRFWLVSHYLPEISDLDRRTLPALGGLKEWLGDIEIRNVPIPHDCTDGFLGAFWGRPEAYLAPAVRHGISVFAKLPSETVNRALARLSHDLCSGRWDEFFGELQTHDSADLGYRLVIVKAGC